MVMMLDQTEIPRAYAYGPCDKLAALRARAKVELSAYIMKKAELGEKLDPSQFTEKVEALSAGADGAES
jgi:hypothetical protein